MGTETGPKWFRSADSGAIALIRKYFTSFSAVTLSCALAAGGFSRFFELGKPTLNHDEPFTSYIITQATWLQIATSAVPTERGTPPLYFLLLKLWCKGVGYGEWQLRAPSAALGTIAILLIFAVGREIYSAQIGAIAAFLLAFNPMHMDYSRDARFYPLFVCLVLINGWLFIRLTRHYSAAAAALYALTFAMSVYAHLYAIFFILAEMAWVARAWLEGRNVRGLIVGVIAGGGLLAPYAAVLACDFGDRLNEQIGYVTNISYAAPLLLYRDAAGSLMWPLILVLAGCGLLKLTDSSGFLAYWAVIPVVAVYVTSLCCPHKLLFTSRYLFSVVPAVLLLAAAGLWRLSNFGRIMIFGVFLYATLVGGLTFRRILLYRTRNWTRIAAGIKRNVGTDEPIALSSYRVHVLRYYLHCGCFNLVGLRCSPAAMLRTPTAKSLWYLHIAENPCDAMLLHAISSRYRETGRSELDVDASLIHFVGSYRGPKEANNGKSAW